MDTLSPIEIDIGRKVASCSRVFWTHLIFLFGSTIKPSPPSLEVFTAQFVFCFVFTGRFGFLASSISFVLPLIKRFESLATDRDSLFVFTVFALFFSKTVLLSLHPSGAIDPNHFRETRKQLATFQYQFQLDSV